MNRFYSFLICLLFLISACKSPVAQQNHNKLANHLAGQSSPYLLQHQYNPVDWYPWGEEALNKSKEENKLMVISIGYSACHWCHVMEHESFEDSIVSNLMNEHFVSIKVDREERPDIDDVYMTACHMASGKSCGWPLNAFALPDGRPVWAGTYFPKKQWLEVLEYFQKLYEEDPEKLEEYATQLTEGIQGQEKLEPAVGDEEFTRTQLDGITTAFLGNIDFKEGGRKGAPKFPMPNNYEFLLKYNYLYGNDKAKEAVTTTLDKMANGGIYDHLGGGFARYSVDNIWLVPHFEKMLYDNGQLVSLYAKAYQFTKDPLYAKVVKETLEYVEREMTSSEGGFYSSLDADSDGEEGKFYVWQKEQIDSLLGNEASELFCEYYDVSKQGNWEHKNILNRKKSLENIIKKFNKTEKELASFIDQSKSILMKERDTRVRPGLDDKILTSWNALMLQGYCDAYQAFNKEEYKKAALKNGNFIVSKMLQKDGRLNRNYKDGKSVINAFLDDYALTINAFTSLYQITFDEKWLEHAKKIADYTITNFENPDNGMFFYTSKLDPALIARKMELTDNVIPGSNSSMARSLFKLGTYTYNQSYIDKSSKMLNNIMESITLQNQPNFYSNWCTHLIDMVQTPYEVAIVGKNSDQIRKELMQHYLPHALFLGGETEGTLELLKDKLQDGETMIYVCQNKVCKLPVMESQKALKLMTVD